VQTGDPARGRARAGRRAAGADPSGFAGEADAAADDVASAGLDGMRFTLRTARERRPVAIPTLGRMAVHNALAGVAVGLAAGCPLDEILAGLADGWAAPHRAELVRLGGVTIVDDSYNASPGSVSAALELLAGLPGRRVAVLGEMLELGDEHDAGHLEVGRAAARAVELLVVAGGAGVAGIGTGAREAGLDPARVLEVPDRDAAFEALRPRLRDGDVVLVKASRGVALDLLVDRLRAELGPLAGPLPVDAAAPDTAAPDAAAAEGRR
jgi:UDP-N-acetylmuramoyl-tripeptide--D-alanyl-D-alanine ligase